MEINWADKRPLNTRVIYLFASSSYAVVNSSENSPALCSHVWYIIYPSGSKTDTSPGSCTLKFKTHLHVCVTTTQESTSWSLLHRFSGRAASSPCLVYGRSSINGSKLRPGPKLGSPRHCVKWRVQGRLSERCCRGTREASEAAVWVPLCKMKVMGSGGFFFFFPLFFSHSLCLNKPCWKELLLWLSMEGFPGMLDQVSGMYRFNEPIWKLTEMERERSGYITHGITTWVSAGGEAKAPWSFLWEGSALSRPESRPF